ncbi:MAG: S8 family serine peptidase [Halolamina sp.]
MSTYNRRTFLKTSGALLGGIAAGTTVTAAERTDRFIVQTRGKSAPRDLDVVHEMPGVDVAVVRGSEKAVRKSKRVKDYAADVEIKLDDPDVNAKAPTVEESSVADEPLYPLQWDKQDLDVGTAHETTKGEGTRVTVIDTGVAAGHPDLDVNESLSRNFTGDGLGSANPAGGYHGTHVGGIVAAQDNELGVIGTAPETDLVDCRVFSPEADASFGDILAAIVYSTAIDADAANLSLGAYPVLRNEGQFGQFYGKALNSTMTYANKEGTLLVIAAGNDSADLQHDKNYISLPNEGAQGLSVSATGPIGFNWGEPGFEDPPESPAYYTNYGTNALDLGAPGGDADLDTDNPNYYLDLVLNTIADPVFDDGDYLGATYDYGWLAGTSMAAPQVAGAAALVKSANPNYNANQVESALKRAADVPDGYDKTYYGSGYLNIVDAL